MTSITWIKLFIICNFLSFTICFISALIYHHVEKEREREEKAKERKNSRAENKELKELLKQIKDIYN